MQLQTARSLAVDTLEELEPLRMGVPAVKTGYHLAVKVVEGGEQGCRAMSVIVVRGGAYVPDAQRQARLRPLKRLYLRLLVAAQDNRLFRRIEVEADDIPEFLLELRVIGEAEAPGQMRLYPIVAPEAAHGAAGDARPGGDLAAGVQGMVCLGHGDDLRPDVGGDSRRAPCAPHVVKAPDAGLQVAAAPFADGHPGAAQLLRHRLEGPSLRRQNDGRADDQPVFRGGPMSQSP